jgi:hypothetical protein
MTTPPTRDPGLLGVKLFVYNLSKDTKDAGPSRIRGRSAAGPRPDPRQVRAGSAPEHDGLARARAPPLCVRPLLTCALCAAPLHAGADLEHLFEPYHPIYAKVALGKKGGSRVRRLLPPRTLPAGHEAPHDPSAQPSDSAACLPTCLPACPCATQRFGFALLSTMPDANAAIDTLNGVMLKGKPMQLKHAVALGSPPPEPAIVRPAGRPQVGAAAVQSRLHGFGRACRMLKAHRHRVPLHAGGAGELRSARCGTLASAAAAAATASAAAPWPAFAPRGGQRAARSHRQPQPL